MKGLKPRKIDGEWVESNLEENALLLATMEEFPLRKKYRNRLGESIIAHSKVEWAIGMHVPYKSAGLDGITTKMLQVCSKRIVPHLVNIVRGCINLSHIPISWGQLKVIYIPKVGKAYHCLI